jgi:hypothetical protein
LDAPSFFAIDVHRHHRHRGKTAQGKHPDGEGNATAGRPALRLFDLNSLRHDSTRILSPTPYLSCHAAMTEFDLTDEQRRRIVVQE